MESTIKKPEPRHHHEPCLSYNEAIAYIEGKYNIDTRDYYQPYTEDKDGDYRDFWHWVLDNCGDQINNGSYFYLPIAEHYDHSPAWVREILDHIKKEFPVDANGGIEFYASW